MADYKRDDWIPVTPHPTLTPREREVERRLKQVETVVSTIVKSIYTDDSLTTLTGPVTVTNNTNTIIPADQRVVQLEKANEDLCGIIDEKDQEIARLTDLVNSCEEKINELEEKLYDITHILGV